MKQGKIIVVSAPSGCGKSTIINALLGSGDFNMRFSVSATNRLPREGERDGEHYHFLTTAQFRDAIAADEFVEWEEVYPGRYYGTLKRELQTAIDRGENIILDIDVKGAINVKKIFGAQARTIFIMPPSIDELRNRLAKRATDPADVIDQRVSKAEYEISFASQFDVQVTNDELPIAIAETESAITSFLNE
jgi:guanylate kinase